MSGGVLGMGWMLQALAGQRPWSIDGVAIISLGLVMQGLQFLALGVMAQYLARVCDEVRNRPMFLVRETIGFNRSAQRVEGRAA